MTSRRLYYLLRLSEGHGYGHENVEATDGYTGRSKIWRMDMCFERVATSLEHGIVNTMQMLSMCLSKHVPPMHLTGSPDSLSSRPNRLSPSPTYLPFLATAQAPDRGREPQDSKGI